MAYKISDHSQEIIINQVLIGTMVELFVCLQQVIMVWNLQFLNKKENELMKLIDNQILIMKNLKIEVKVKVS